MTTKPKQRRRQRKTANRPRNNEIRFRPAQKWSRWVPAVEYQRDDHRDVNA